MKKTLLTLLAIPVFTVAAFGDIAPGPGESPSPVKTRMQIRIDPDIKETKLVISRSALESLLEADGGARASAVRAGFTRSQTIFGGILISASFVFGGVWLSRRGLQTGGAARTASAAVILAAGAVIVMANAAPPIFQRIDSKVFSDAMKKERFAGGNVAIEISNDEFAEGVELIVAQEKKSAGAPAE